MSADLLTTASTTNHYPPHLGDLLDRVVAEQIPLTATYQGQVFVALVPIQDAELFEEIEDYIDCAYIAEARQEEDSIPLEQVQKELGLEMSDTILPETPTEELDDSPSLTELLDLAVAKKKRITLTFQHQVLVALVPIEEVELRKKIENTLDYLGINSIVLD